jgi:hypothetical protein
MTTDSVDPLIQLEVGTYERRGRESREAFATDREQGIRKIEECVAGKLRAMLQDPFG